jgi:hypothetical protein
LVGTVPWGSAKAPVGATEGDLGVGLGMAQGWGPSRRPDYQQQG